MGTTQKSAHKDTTYLGTIQKAYHKTVNKAKKVAELIDEEFMPRITNFTYSKPAKFAQNRRKELKKATCRRMRKHLRCKG